LIDDKSKPWTELGGEAQAVVRMGKALLSAGACTYRVRRCMELVAASLGIEKLETQVGLNELSITLFKQGGFRTQVGQVHSIAINADKLSKLEKMADNLTATTAADIEHQIDAIDARAPFYAPWLNALCAAVACTAVGFLNNAWWLVLIGVFVGAFLGQYVRVKLTVFRLNPYLTALISALIAAFIYVGIALPLSLLAQVPSNYGAGFVPAIIFLVPGFPLVNAILDLIKTDVTAGLGRLAYAFMILVSAAAALVVVSWAVGVQPDPLPLPALNPALHWTLIALTSWLGVSGWAIMFNARLTGALTAGCVGLVANLVRLTLIEVESPPWLAAAIACFIIGLLASWAAQRIGVAYATISVPAALIMVPGVAAYRALVAFSDGDATALLTNSSAAIFTIIGMAIGLSIARILTEREWILDRRRPLVNTD
jgi:uncharacterized membrane protein YjjP (DUF1212 family)